MMSTLKEKQKEFRAVAERIRDLQAKAATPEGSTSDALSAFKEALDKAEQLKGLIEDLQRAEGVDQWSKGVTFVPTGDAVTVGVNPDDDAPIKAVVHDGGGEFSTILRKTLEPAYKRAWVNFMRNSADTADMKALAEGRDADGGVLVPADMANEILVRKPHPTAVLGAVNRVRTSKDVVKYMRLEPTTATDDTIPTGLRVEWTGEQGTTNENTSLQNWGFKTIPIHTGTFDVRAYSDILEDSEVDLAAFIANEARNVYELDAAENNIIGGNGVGRPSGILRAVATAFNPGTTNIGNPLTKNGLLDLIAAVAPQYRRDARFLSDSSSTWADIAQLDTGTGGSLIGWRSTIAGISAPLTEMIFGYQAIFSPYMPAAGASANVVVFGDFRQGYYWVERVGLTAHPYGQYDGASLRANQVGWLFRFRAGGDVMNYRALRVGVQS